jgi:UDP-glucuronate 4-epimerase
VTRILLTGAAGFIGSHLAERLLAEGDEVTGLDAFDETLYPASIKERNAAALAQDAKFTLVRGTIEDAALLGEVAPGHDLVVHLAALAGVRPSLRQPHRYARVNVEGTIHVLEACRAAGISRMIFASSSSVYGARPGAAAGFREDEPCNEPASPYAATKRAGELLASTYHALHGIGVTSLRFFTVYGPRQRRDMAIDQFTRALAAGRPVTLFGDGTSARDYTFIDDIVDGVVAACRRVQPGRLRTYNLGGAQTTSLARLVEVIAAALGVTPRVEHVPNQPGDVPFTWADVSRAEGELGYAPHTPVEEGIRRFVDWFRRFDEG